jgi:hypothetical protein
MRGAFWPTLPIGYNINNILDLKKTYLRLLPTGTIELNWVVVHRRNGYRHSKFAIL